MRRPHWITSYDFVILHDNVMKEHQTRLYKSPNKSLSAIAQWITDYRLEERVTSLIRKD